MYEPDALIPWFCRPYKNVWSAAWRQAETRDWQKWSAKMYSAYWWSELLVLLTCAHGVGAAAKFLPY
jgi:hypothetical protein